VFPHIKKRFPGILRHFLESSNCYFQAIVLFQARNLHCKLEHGVDASEFVVNVHISTDNLYFSKFSGFVFISQKLPKNSGFLRIQEISFEEETLAQDQHCHMSERVALSTTIKHKHKQDSYIHKKRLESEEPT